MQCLLDGGAWLLPHHCGTNGTGKKLSRSKRVVLKEGKAELQVKEGEEEDTPTKDDEFTANIYKEIANTIRPKSWKLISPRARRRRR